MADQEQVELLKQGVKVWNQWRWMHPDVQINLSKADLSEADLRRVDLRKANLRRANLNKANLSEVALWDSNFEGANLHRANLVCADISDAVLNEANLSEADLSGADLSGAWICDADFSGTVFQSTELSGATFARAVLRDVNFNGADLSGAYFYDVDLIHADLSGSFLFATQLFNSNLTSVNLTGACIQDWNINNVTQLNEVICEYIYLKGEWSEEEQKYFLSDRRPSDPNRIFAPGEFQAFVQKLLSTVDLIFADGIDWTAFFHSFQELRSQYDDNLSIQAIEKKSGGAFVIRLEVPPEANKGEIEYQAKERYQHKLQLLETQYRAELHAKDREIKIYKQQSTDMLEIVKLQASRPINPIAIAGSQTMGDRNIHIGSGNYNERIEGNYVQGDYINMSQDLTQAAQQIHDLLRQLQNQGATVEDSQKKVATQMAKQAETDPSMMGKLVLWSKAMTNKASETTVSEAVKIVLTLALKAAGLPSP